MHFIALAQFVSANAETGIGWLTLSFINAGLAEAKNRNRLGWWLASLVLGPLVTAAIVLVDRGEPDERT